MCTFLRVCQCIGALLICFSSNLGHAAVCGGAWCEEAGPPQQPGNWYSAWVEFGEVSVGYPSYYYTSFGHLSVYLWRKSADRDTPGRGEHFFILGEIPKPTVVPQPIPRGAPGFDYWERRFAQQRDSIVRPPTWITPVVTTDPDPGPLGPEFPFSQDTYNKLQLWLEVFAVGSSEIIGFRSHRNIATLINNLGQKIGTDALGGFSRVGGVMLLGTRYLIEFGPETAAGWKVFHDAVRNNESLTRGLLSEPRNRSLRNAWKILEQIDAPAPAQPIKSTGGTSTFRHSVRPGTLRAYDPPLAVGFEYNSPEPGPKFASFVAPYISYKDIAYDLQFKILGKWTTIAKVNALREFQFTSPIRQFRLIGISPKLKITPAGHAWVTGLSFDRQGVFAGTIRALTAP